MDLAGAVAALLDGRFDDLFGLEESVWLDAKGGIYELDNPAKAEELVKDVAAFANTATGGLLVVGIGTRVEHGQEILAHLKPVPRGRVDLDRHRKLIRERITPPPRGVEVDWIPVDDESGVLLIHVPAQLPGRLPHLVAAPTRGAQGHPDSVAVPVREGDGTVWLPRTEVQRLLAAGWTATGGPSHEVLAEIAAQAASAAVQQKASAVVPIAPGEGMPSAQRRWAAAYEALGGEKVLGTADGRIYAEGPGLVQHFAGTGTGRGWVLCELSGRPVVAVPEGVWEAMRLEGSGALGGDSFAALGFPDPGAVEAGAAPALVDGAAGEVRLINGSWGPGRLVRRGDGAAWQWEPQLQFSSESTRAGRNWTSQVAAPQLRLRVIATLPWADARTFEVEQVERRKLLGGLGASQLSQYLGVLAMHHGSDFWMPKWDVGQLPGCRNSYSYAAVLTGADGRTALSGEVFLALPNSADSSVVTCAEVKVGERDAWDQLVRADGQPGSEPKERLTLEDLYEFTVAALEMATEELPGSLSTGASQRRWSGVPTAEIRLTAEYPHDHSGPRRPVADFIDFSAFGAPAGREFTEMAVTVVAPPVLQGETRRAVARQALVRMGRDFGFLDADESAF
ncbi:RNA-binding domain-containing protein [Kitasatospora purpeofusca]|uniref:RNA-binding domain-containing protein n=1 Tax=Kitasatospora purpeofusca TaxID=67352 RepID=UPI00368DAF33